MPVITDSDGFDILDDLGGTLDDYLPDTPEGIVFDPSTKRIILDSASVTATELYSRSCDWLALSDNLKYGPIFRQVGGDDLGGGLYIPPYFFLQGLWRIRPMESDHLLIITGNMFVEGGGVPVVNTIGNYNVLVNMTVPVQAQAFYPAGSGLPDAELARMSRIIMETNYDA